MKASKQAALLLAESASHKKLTLEQRRRVFRELVTAQDAHLGVAASRQQVMAEFGLEEDQLRAIEDEGIDKEWPPL
jgi:hypothetical protein